MNQINHISTLLLLSILHLTSTAGFAYGLKEKKQGSGSVKIAAGYSAAYLELDVVVAGSNITANLTGVDSELLDAFNLVVGSWGLLKGGNELITKFSDLKNTGTAAGFKPVSVKDAENFLKKYDESKIAGKPVPKSIENVYDYLKYKVPGYSGDLLARLKSRVPANKWDDFVGDFEEDMGKLARFEEDPGLVESWQILGESADLRKNIDALETLDYYKKHVNSNVDELTNSFKSATNKEDWFSGKIAEIRKQARELPGTSNGNGIVVEGQWMRGTQGNIGLFPKRIADKLKGKNFKNFAEFRSEFWKAVADDPDLFEQFGASGKAAMKKGESPFVLPEQRWGGRKRYEIHHKTPIHDGGGVYDIDNLVIVTPRYHKEVLDPAYHFKKK